jgi:hypothetical protein
MDVRGSGLYIVVLHGSVSNRVHADGLNRSLAPSRRDLSHTNCSMRKLSTSGVQHYN